MSLSRRGPGESSLRGDVIVANPKRRVLGTFRRGRPFMFRSSAIRLAERSNLNFSLDLGTQPVSNVCSAQPDEGPDDLGNVDLEIPA